jgi:two-component system, NarL family, response regulator NreC
METGMLLVDESAAVPEGDRRPAHAEEWRKYARLTERERAVLQYVASGFTAPEIGKKLLISAKTVDTYKQRINQKLALSHRSEYVTFALKLGLLA